ncbi:MAG: glycosyltransferase family 1 protein [Planctomycetota bacterium]|nr:MAG: glycosyltransferase family 1 protein [Planctomycetota bacterium]
MRVLLANNYHYLRGGSERVYFELAGLLREKGHDTGFFSVSDPQCETNPYQDFFVSPISFDTGQGWKVKLRTAGRMLYSKEAVHKLQALLGRESFDVLHAHNIYHRVNPVIFKVARKRGMPTAMTMHDYKLGCSVYNFFRNGEICTECLEKGRHRVFRNRCTKGSTSLSAFHWMEASLHHWLGIYRKNVDAFICPSRFSARMHVRAGLPEQNVHYLPNFVHVDHFQPKETPGEYFVYAGRLAAEKGTETLLQAIRSAEVPLKFAGTGPLLESLKKKAQRFDMKQVDFLGHLDSAGMDALLKNARALILPSEWFENAPMSILEAFATGVPVIGADIGGIPEMVLPGKTGQLHASGDAESLAEALVELWRNPDAAFAMGRNARRMAEEVFSPGVHYQGLRRIYQHIGVAA